MDRLAPSLQATEFLGQHALGPMLQAARCAAGPSSGMWQDCVLETHAARLVLA